jgi:hypothetical protein
MARPQCETPLVYRVRDPIEVLRVKSRKNPIGRIQEEPQVSQALNSKNNLMNGVRYPMKKQGVFQI